MKAMFTAGGKLCDSCKSSTTIIFCRVDSTFLRLSCDSKIHPFNKLNSQPHSRFWMCEVCEQAPAVVTCKTNAVALCVTCDFDIHYANPLARRHERIPVEPFYDSAAAELVVLNSSTLNFFGKNGNKGLGGQSADFDATN